MVRKALIFILALAVCDGTLYTLLSIAFRHIETGESGGIVNKARRVKAQVVVLGSSRAKHQYDTEVLGKTIKASVYNAGCNGQGIPYMRGVADLLLHDYVPRLLIINVDAVSLVFQQNIQDSVNVLAPFMDESAVIRRMIYNRSTFEPLKYISRSYRYNSKPLAILKNYFSKDTTIRGFEPLKRIFDAADSRPGSDALQTHGAVSADVNLVQMLRDLIHQAKSKGTRVVLANAPQWRIDGKVDQRHKPLLNFLQGLAREEDVLYLSVTQENTALFRDPSLFSDPDHLNGKGAQLFAEIVAPRIALLGYAEPVSEPAVR